MTAPLLRYSVLGIPLAFVGLPIYVHVPHYYATTYGVDLVSISIALLIVRFIDAFQDPLIGWMGDRSHISRRTIILCATLPLIAAFIGLFRVPEAVVQSPYLIGWMFTMLLIVYTAFSVIMIHYYAAGLAFGEAIQTRLSAFREGGILIGVMMAAVLPSIFTEQMGLDDRTGYGYFSLTFIPLCLVCVAIAVGTLPRTKPPAVNAERPSFFAAFGLLKDRDIRRVLLLFFVNSIPTAITSTLFLFFVEDVLRAKEQAGFMLLCYFAFAALSVGGWAWLSNRIGKRHALCVGMALAIASFVWAYGLGAGDVTAFYIICAISGIAVGADVTLLPALFADVLESRKEQAGMGYSLWHFLSKFNLSLAAGIVLPLLAFTGYVPLQTSITSSTSSLSLVYALIPCGFKMIALFLTLSQGRNVRG